MLLLTSRDVTRADAVQVTQRNACHCGIKDSVLRARAGTTKVQIWVNVRWNSHVAPQSCCTPVLCLWNEALGSGGWQGPAGHSRVQGTPHTPVCTVPEGCSCSLQHRPKALNLISALPGIGVTAEGLAGLSLLPASCWTDRWLLSIPLKAKISSLLRIPTL